MLGLLEDCGPLSRPELPLSNRPAKHVDTDVPYRADDVNIKMDDVSTGTTIMAVVFDGGVIMGADSRTSTGDYVANRASRKVSKVHDRTFVCRSGSAADTQALTAMVQDYIGQQAINAGPGTLPKVMSAAKLFQILAYNNKDRLMAGLIVGGWDRVKGGQVYSIPLGGSLIEKKVAVGGSGSGYITAMIADKFRENMSQKEAEEFVALCISHAMAADGSSGGVIRMTIIKEESVEERFHAGDKLPYGP